MQKLFINKMLQKLFKNISTDGEVISKLKLAYFFVFLGQGVVYMHVSVFQLGFHGTESRNGN